MPTLWGYIANKVTKFQQNRSTSAVATASLVRSLKSISFHYRHRRDWLSSVRPCDWQDASTPKVCVQTSECPPCARTQARRRERHCLTALSMTTWWKCSHSSIWCDFSWSSSRIWLRYTRSCNPPNLVVDWVKVRTVGWPQSWSDEVWCFMS